MGEIDKFASLFRYFYELKEYEVNMTFEQIEGILGEKLCNSAYTHRSYWYSESTHIFPKCWIDNEYKMTYLNLNKHRVNFTKVRSISSARNTNNTTKNLINIRNESTIKIDEVLLAIIKYYSALEADENSRYLSWEHCYRVFQEFHNKSILTTVDIDYLSLHLAFYLASWGMLRGSSFLLQKDYRVHTDIIKELFKPCYNNLWCIKYAELHDQKNLDILIDLINNLRTIYRGKRMNIKEVSGDISDILITKVLLGTLGCVPAYDEYFKNGVNKYNITIKFLRKSSLIGLADYYEENKDELEDVRNTISKAHNLEYPQMKILDMAFWQLGFDFK